MISIPHYVSAQILRQEEGVNCTFYVVEVKTSLTAYILHRRYTDFKNFYISLQKSLPLSILDSLEFPATRGIKKFLSSDSGKRKREQLDVFLRRCVESSEIIQDIATVNFLELQPPKNIVLTEVPSEEVDAAAEAELIHYANSREAKKSFDSENELSSLNLEPNCPIDRARLHSLDYLSSSRCHEPRPCLDRIQSSPSLIVAPLDINTDSNNNEFPPKEGKSQERKTQSGAVDIQELVNQMAQLQNSYDVLRNEVASLKKLLYAPTWQMADACQVKECTENFSLPFHGRHHCRRCGLSVCSAHSEHKATFIGVYKPSRVCNNCHDVLLYHS